MQITCYDRDGKEVKRVTSTSGEVEDPENTSGGENQNQGGESQNGGSQNNSGSGSGSNNGGEYISDED